MRGKKCLDDKRFLILKFPDESQWLEKYQHYNHQEDKYICVNSVIKLGIGHT